ncbi:glycosyltransferase family 39 protein [Nocardia sp. 2]|uniref:Glycosyltransferase family 39 protein n=1 Tax=Nocardia acididurans TaxID=2802282 RepID=A0ABS1MI35_9NOCA|nr:glycosyltransferase family 39 protein [Nocardia acididurans]MBL1079705.1 glycosyltransferase family 39 protein [Nocardia acididurans]
MTLTHIPESEKTTPTHPRFAWRGVLLVSGVATLALSVSAARFQLAGDELYYLACGRRLAVDYVDNGPLVPLIARLCDLLAPGSALALRIPGLLALFAVAVLAAAVACECGARPRYQMLAAAACIASPLVFAFTVLTTVAFDLTLQALVIWLLIRWVRTRRDRLLIAVGVAAALDVQDKWLILLAAACLGLGVLAAGPRAMLRRPALWLGLLIFAAAAVPPLLWQASRDWPQLATNSAIAHEMAQTGGGQWGTVAAILILPGFLGGGLVLLGMYGLVRLPDLRPYRFVLIAGVLMLTLVLAGQGRAYYVAGVIPALLGVGAATLAGLLATARARVPLRRGFSVLTALSAVTLVFLALLPYPRSWIDEPAVDYLGAMRHYGNDYWTDLADAVETVVDGLPAADRADAVVVAAAYNQAGALDHYGRSRGLPPVYSPHRGFAEFGPPPDSAKTIIYVAHDSGREQRAFLAAFGDTTAALRLNDSLGIGGQNRYVTVWICRDPRTPLSAAWPELTYMVTPPTP